MILTANEGMWLTQKKDVIIYERVCAKSVSVNERLKSNWIEITDERKIQYDAELAEWLKEQEEEV